jgi:hypothetical protein
MPRVTGGPTLISLYIQIREEFSCVLKAFGGLRQRHFSMSKGGNSAKSTSRKHSVAYGDEHYILANIAIPRKHSVAYGKAIPGQRRLHLTLKSEHLKPTYDPTYKPTYEPLDTYLPASTYLPLRTILPSLPHLELHIHTLGALEDTQEN